MGKVGNERMRIRDPIIILIGKLMMNVGKYIVYNIMLNLRKGDDYLSDKMPIWFSNTRYYENKRIVDRALKSVYRVKVNEQNIDDESYRDWTKDSMESFKGTDHTPLDLGYTLSRDRVSKRFSKVEVEGDNYPDVVMNGNWKPVHR
jgi:hypothetical protein